MNQFFKRRAFALKVGLSCLLVGILISFQINSNSVSAQSPFINSEINSLKARITRLEQEVNRLRNPNFNIRPRASQPPKTDPLPPATPPQNNPPVVDGQGIGPSNPFYERLATLLIELKEDVRNIEQRLEQVESQVTPN